MTIFTKIIAALALTFTMAASLGAHANETASEEAAPQQMDAATQAEIHSFLCTGPQAEQLQEPKIKEIRDQVVRFLANPAQTAQELLDQGSKDDIGPFGLLAACAMVIGLEDTLTAKGCIADDGTKLEAAPALELCKSMLTQIAK